MGVKTKKGNWKLSCRASLNGIEAQKKEITIDDIDKVALTSSNDPELAVKFKEIYQQIGKDGIIEFDNSHLPGTLYEISDGVKLRKIS